MSTTNTRAEDASDKLFDIAAQNQGFKSLEEMAEVTSWFSSDVDPSSISEFMDDPASSPITPKPEFKERFEAWLEERRTK